MRGLMRILQISRMYHNSWRTLYTGHLLSLQQVCGGRISICAVETEAQRD